MMDSDVMDGLTIAKERGDDRVEMRDLLFRKSKAGAGFRFQGIVLFLSERSAVKRFFKRTPGTDAAGIADIGRLFEAGADKRSIGGTSIHAFAAGPAEPFGSGRTSGAERTDGAGMLITEETIVKSPTGGTGFFFADVFADFFGDSGTVFTDQEGDLFKRRALIELGLDQDPLIER